MEGSASDGEYLYIVGSHSLHRAKSKPNGTHQENRERLTDVEEHEDSFHLFRIQLDDGGELVSKEDISLREFLKDDAILKRFCKIPSKENGIDSPGFGEVGAGYSHVSTLSSTGGGTTGGGGTTSTPGGGSVVTVAGYQASANLRQLLFDFNHTRALVHQGPSVYDTRPPMLVDL